MSVQAMLHAQYREMHQLLEVAIGDCTSASLTKRLPGATINSIGPIYAHTIFSEDGLVNGLVRGRTPIYHAGGWAKQIGIPMPQGGLEPDWDVTLDLAAFRDYANEVYKDTEEWLGGASEEELARVVNPGFTPPMPAGTLMGTVMLWHVATHQGEISALKGAQGLVGLNLTSH